MQKGEKSCTWMLCLGKKGTILLGPLNSLVTELTLWFLEVFRDGKFWFAWSEAESLEADAERVAQIAWAHNHAGNNVVTYRLRSVKLGHEFDEWMEQVLTVANKQS